MSPLTTPYSGRVAGGDMDAARTSSPAQGPNSCDGRGLKAFRRGAITRGRRNRSIAYLKYAMDASVGPRACQAGASAAVMTRSADGQA